jgi:hypothetical protein
MTSKRVLLLTAAASPEKGIGKPIVAYHFLNAGSVLGNFHTTSVTVGLVKRVEFGYTRTFHQDGSTASLSSLWSGGFNIVHAKLNLVAENAGKNHWVPAISTGFVARTQVRHVSGTLANQDYNNADFYAVASKTITQTKAVPIVLNLGYKATNASVFGLAGNAPAYQGRLFGAAQAAGKIMPGVDLKARHQFALGISYGI